MSREDVYKTVVIGGGQAGLAAGYFLKKQGSSFAILDENPRTGDAWRKRWDSLRLFTPSKYNGLPGMPFPGADFYFPTKDEAADYLEAYASRFNLPIRRSTKVISLARDPQGYCITTSAGSLSAKSVIVATGPYQKPHTPPFARELDPRIRQLHSSTYCNPDQLPGRRVLVVGAGNSGAEISLELARSGRQVFLAGSDVGRIPADQLGRLFGGGLYWFLISRVLSVHTPVGKQMREKVIRHGAPLIRSSRDEVAKAGIESLPRVSRVEAGRPVLADGRSLDTDAVIWATGFRPDYGWIELPVFDESGYPRHERGVLKEAPGLYFLGLPFQTALSSALLGGIGSEAEYITRYNQHSGS